MFIRKLILCIVGFLLLVNCAAAQRENSDSLKQELEKAKEDTNKVKVLMYLSWNYVHSYPDSTILYSLPGLKLAKKTDFKEGEAWLLLATGEALAVKSNYSLALEMQLKALTLAENIKNQRLIQEAHVWIGNVYFYAGDYTNALLYYTQYFNLDKKQKNYTPEEGILALIGESYFHLNQLDSAMIYVTKAYELEIKKSQKSRGWTVPYHYLGEIYAAKKQYQLSLDFFRKSFLVAKAEGPLPMAEVYNGIAVVFKRMELIDSAIYYARKAIDVSREASLTAQIIEASLLLTDIYRLTQQRDSLLKYQGILLAGKDSILSQEKVRQLQLVTFNEQMRKQEIVQEEKTYQARIRMYAMAGIIAGILIISVVLFRSNRHRKKAYLLLQRQKQEIDFQKTKVEQTLEDLKTTQVQLIQSEKMASLGELTAGIAHEIQNPLNFVNNFSEVNEDLIQELKEEADRGHLNEVRAIAMDIAVNSEKINYHGKRADAIVKSMLQHSRAGSGQKELTDINALCDEYARLSYHGLRAKDKSFNATLETDLDPGIQKISVVPQEIGRVILNLLNNAFYAAVRLRKPTGAIPESGQIPTVWISTRDRGDKVEIRVRDNGPGIPAFLLDKIFEPFFTTKPTGEGTGLGLSLSYDIVTKGHRGELKVESKEGEFAEFIIILPY